MKYTAEEKLEILRKRLRETENELLRLRQLRPLVSIGDGWSQCISFEQMSEFATLWMEQNGIHTKEDLDGGLVEMKEIREVCPLCEQGVLVETEEDFLVFSVCTHCKCEVADAEQTEINKHSYICDCTDHKYK